MVIQTACVKQNAPARERQGPLLLRDHATERDVRRDGRPRAVEERQAGCAHSGVRAALWRAVLV